MPSEGAAGDEFGYAVVIREDTIVIGARGDGDGGSSAGAAYVYHLEESAWVRKAKLVASDAAAYSSFGWSVAMDWPAIAVGCPGSSNSAGSVYLYQWNGATWEEIARMTAPEPVAYDKLGNTVSISDGVTMSGAYGYDQPANYGGAAFLFAPQAFWEDADDDDIPDVWETLYYGRTTNCIASNDDDGDGASNVEEYIADTGPTDAQSVLGIVGVGAGSWHISFPASARRVYTLEYRDNLDEGLWLDLHGPVWGNGEILTLTDTNAVSQRFYRMNVALPY